MAYLYELPNATGGIDSILVETVSAVPSFTPLLLMFVYFMVLIGGVGRQKARTGTADYPMWATVAGLSTFMVAMMMTLIEGLIRLDWLIVVIVFTIFSSVWLFFDKKAGEI